MEKNYLIGVDLGGTRTKIGLVDRAFALKDLVVMPTPRHCGALLDGIKNCIDGMLLKNGLVKEQLRGIGASIGSFIFARNRVDTMCDFIDVPDGFPLARAVEESIGIPCRVENDAYLIALAEARYGAARGHARAITLTLGTGVGFGFTDQGNPRDALAYQHLAGHIRVRSPGEEPVLDANNCYCGIDGCLESTCSGTALGQMGSAALGREVSAEDLFRLAAEDGTPAKAVIDRYVDYLMRALNQYTLLIAPDCIVLGGGVAHGLAPFLPQLNERLFPRVYSGHQPCIRLAELHESGGVLGAATLFEGEESK